MHSSLPKVLHLLLGRPLIAYALDAVEGLSAEPPVLVVGHGAEQVEAAVGSRAQFVTQQPQLGTADAVRSAESLLKGRADLVVVMNGDLPLLRHASLERLVRAQQEDPGALSLLTVNRDESQGFGRILRDAQGRIVAIQEEAQLQPGQEQVHEFNVGAYCFAADWLWPALARVPLSPKGEYYVTDLIALAAQDGQEVRGVPVEDPEEAEGINTRVHLARIEALLRRRVNERWMEAGVTMIDPATTYIEAGVTLGEDTILWPNTHLRGETRIGQGCEIGPGTLIRDSRIGDRCRVLASVLEGAELEDDVDMGPFGHLRSGAHLARGVHMGNFGEVKNSYLAPGTKMGHFSYIGDATIGENVNIGAGTITCNFDGEKKNPTEIGANAFIGSDTMLVAPVKVGEGAHTGAGAVVTHDVPPHTTVVGVPARPLPPKKDEG